MQNNIAFNGLVFLPNLKINNWFPVFFNHVLFKFFTPFPAAWSIIVLPLSLTSWIP